MKTLQEWSVAELMADAAPLIIERHFDRLAPVACFKVQYEGMWYSLQITPYHAVQYDGLKSKEVC